MKILERAIRRLLGLRRTGRPKVLSIGRENRRERLVRALTSR